ncbi:MAG: LysM peptidoglycan-binding domain-containing protein [Thermodesulfovibrionales bacterium]
MRRLFVFLLLIFSLFLPAYTLGDTIYTVKKGDSLYKISKKYGVSIRDLKAENSIKSYRIKPGIKLHIPEEEKVPEDTPKSNKNSEVRPRKPETIISASLSEKEKKFDESYTVKKGDTLASISRRYSISIDELKEKNHLRSTRIRPGQQLIIKSIHPKTYEVKKGDNLFRIAKRFDLSLDELKQINSLETDSLRPGQILLLETEKKVEEISLPDREKKKEKKEASVSEDISNMGIREKLILFAKKMMDIPYRFGGNSIFGIDCSGFVQKVYSMIGISLPRSARQQFEEGKPIDKADLSIGDLVFFRTYAPFPSHVGIYLGDDLFIHASSIKKKVTIDSLTTPFYLKRFIGAKRVIGIEGEEGG